MMDCDVCRFGVLQPTRMSFISEIEGQIMVIPDAPAYKCDMCGALEYDHAFLSQIQYTLEQLNLPPEPTPPIQRPSLRNRRPVWQPPRKA